MLYIVKIIKVQHLEMALIFKFVINVIMLEIALLIDMEILLINYLMILNKENRKHFKKFQARKMVFILRF